MKKLFAFVSIVCLCCLFYQPRGSKQIQVLDIVTSNIECLAQGESSNYFLCVGIGSLDCNGEKVHSIYTNLSLPFD